jgi:demethylmenaquinone methyltransferase/2-methoxy-6-polyprenyl-1,4-benzoquinol methylase
VSKPALAERLFSIWAQFWDSLLNFAFYFPCGGEEPFRKKCLDFARPAKEDHVLDLCCGTGTLTSLIAGRVGPEGHVVGVDISESVLEIARTRVKSLPATFLRAGAGTLPFDSPSFNKCFISFGLHHMSKQDRQNTLGETRRALIRSGSLFVFDYSLPDKVLARLMAKALTKLDKSEEAYNMLVNDSLIREIQQAGLEIRRRESTYIGMIQLIEAVKP